MKLKESDYVKIVVTVPVTHADAVRKVLNDAGASRQGNYELASASWRVTGRFRPFPGAKPAIGEQGKLEEVEEEMIETLCHRDRLEEAVVAIRKVHPYEEPAIDVYQRYEIAE